MTEIVLPNDTNGLGNMMGGRLMYLMDKCAAVSAQRHANCVCVTAAVDSVDRPIARAGIDHWHQADLVHHCGRDLPPSETFESIIGIHTHADGLVHVHPYVDEQESTLGEYLESGGGLLTDNT